ncbi:hypothetical protein HAHE_34530 [Haloferula helveola]|uniref:Uncharacterized protein n=1 Tax=Haloferula helveola TaxID=490095 RepID=A0ABN6H7A2_9BACT|nr:hypothetical protein HAHE_34530 [Haloferula helveola]
MIALIGNRPAIQVGNYQVHDYDTRWLGDALERAAAAAERQDFPFLDEIRQGIEEYLETRCSLELLPLPTLFERVRMMLEKIGCSPIASKLEPLAPPVTLSLEHAARTAGNGFELAFFEYLRSELRDLRDAGAEEIHFTHLRECVALLRQSDSWDDESERLLTDIRGFLYNHHRDHRDLPRPLRMRVENERIE